MVTRHGTELPVAASWFAAADIGPGVVRITEPHVHPLLRSNTYVVMGSERTLVVDTGLGIARLRDAHPALHDGRNVLTALTHGHYDHTGGAWEFHERLAHPAEAQLLSVPEPATLLGRDFDLGLWDALGQAGVPFAEQLVDAIPRPGFDLEGYGIRPAPTTGTVEDGDTIDLGDRRLRVLHLPGHSPGCIALLDERRGELFTGDAVYDEEPLLDDLPESDRALYRITMRRLLELDVQAVHGGHGPSFDGARLAQLARSYLDRTNSVC